MALGCKPFAPGFKKCLYTCIVATGGIRVGVIERTFAGARLPEVLLMRETINTIEILPESDKYPEIKQCFKKSQK